MACFLAPAAEAVIVTAVKHSCKKKEAADSQSTENTNIMKETEKIPFSKKLNWLTTMLWGGCFLLLIEHIWHGEVVPWFPFLTAMENPADIHPMLMEIASVGTAMALLVSAVWIVMVIISTMLEKKAANFSPSAKKAKGV